MGQSSPRRRRPSPFVAAVLSLIFPGLGQLYAGRAMRALVFATPAYLSIALLGGLVIDRDTREALIAGVFAPDVLQLVLVLDVLIAVYRIVAVVDAYRIAALARSAADAAPDDAGAGPAPAPPRVASVAAWAAVLRPVSLAGLVAVIGVLLLGHVALARYDRIAYDTITGITTGDAGPVAAIPTPGGTQEPGASPSPAAPGSAAPAIVPWNGKDRLNVLLLGTDQRPGNSTFNTDTMIIASIDPATGQVAMFSVPRDTMNVPLPPGSAAQAAFTGGVYPYRINSLWAFAQGNPGIFPGTSATRGAAALKGALGTLLGIDIKYYVMVNFGGFEKVIDTLGGVMIDVQIPVQDYAFPARDDRGALKLYIPPGIQYMNGAQALEYARARHQTSDFERAQRQQRVITSVRQQTDVLSLLDPNRLDALSTDLRSAIHSDFPSAQLPALISLMEKVDLANLRSYVFTPPVYQTACTPAQCQVMYFIHPKLAAIRQAVRDAFTVDPALEKSRLRLASEDEVVWVLDGAGRPAAASAVADYLDYLGVGALVPPLNGGRADKSTYQGTVVTFYNGAQARLPETVRVLQATFGVKIVTATDPSIKADVIVITGRQTPRLTVPSQ